MNLIPTLIFCAHLASVTPSVENMQCNVVAFHELATDVFTTQEQCGYEYKRQPNAIYRLVSMAVKPTNKYFDKHFEGNEYTQVGVSFACITKAQDEKLRKNVETHYQESGPTGTGV